MKLIYSTEIRQYAISSGRYLIRIDGKTFYETIEDLLSSYLNAKNLSQELSIVDIFGEKTPFKQIKNDFNSKIEVLTIFGEYLI